MTIVSFCEGSSEEPGEDALWDKLTKAAPWEESEANTPLNNPVAPWKIPEDGLH